MLMNNKFKAPTLAGNPTGNLRCYVLASRALSMSCSFGQSERSIGGVVKYIILWYTAGLILGLRPANERRRYKVTPSLIGWAQT